MKTTEFKDLGELILNESFRSYTEGTNQEAIKKWKKWVHEHPDRKEEFEKAEYLLKTLLNKKKALVTTDKKRSLLELMKYIDKEKSNSSKELRIFGSIWFKIAAASLILIAVCSLWNTFHVPKIIEENISYNEIIVPLGEKAQVILSDGSHVWINSASKLRYPVKFGETSRDVTLEGEAFFDVTKQNNKTFVVNTRDVKVYVLGTAFNVKCYPGDKKTQTIVVRGIVEVEELHGSQKSIIVKPNEIATTREKPLPGETIPQISAIKITKVNTESLVSWKDQMLVFSGESFEDLAIKMERWFNVNIKIDNNELKSERYNGKFVHNETVYQVLEAIKITTPITYEVENDTIIISKN